MLASTVAEFFEAGEPADEIAGWYHRVHLDPPGDKNPRVWDFPPRLLSDPRAERTV